MLSESKDHVQTKGPADQSHSVWQPKQYSKPKRIPAEKNVEICAPLGVRIKIKSGTTTAVYHAMLEASLNGEVPTSMDANSVLFTIKATDWINKKIFFDRLVRSASGDG